MQHVLVANKKSLVQGCKNAVAHSRPRMWSARTFFCFYISCMWMLYGKGYMCAPKICCVLLTFTEHFASMVKIQDFDECFLCNFTLWMTHCIGRPGLSSRSCPLYTSLATTLCKFYRCSKGMRNVALCRPCECLIPIPFWRNYKTIAKPESSQPCLSESVMTQQWFKPQTGAYRWRQKLRLETSLRFIIARCANLVILMRFHDYLQNFVNCGY